MSYTLPTEDGWYESQSYPLDQRYDPYVLCDGQWYEVNGNGWKNLSNERMREDFSPLFRLVVDTTAPDQ